MPMMPLPTLTDPTYRADRPSSALDRFFQSLINDPRDVPFLHFIIRANLIVLPCAIYLFLPGRFSWWLFVPYEALVIFFMGPFVLMLHNTCHRPLFRRRYHRLNYYIPWGLGPLFGETPDTYYAHHIAMHHPENNLDDDLSSTMRYRRDSIVDFAKYFTRFFFSHFAMSSYFYRRRRFRILRRLIVGEASFYALVAVLAYFNFPATFTVSVMPFLLCRFGMMSGNWAQHAFIDPAHPENPYTNSITCINTAYNRRCYNDGYHIGHHIRATRHWTEMPVEFSREQAEYARHDAVVFQGIDYFGVWVCLMLHRYDWLARRYVQLGETPRSEAEIIELLKSRTRPITVDALAAAA